jgi:diguanylate cyclase
MAVDQKRAPPRPAAAAPSSPADIAKAALRRLALAKLEPTPENYAQAWSEEIGQPVNLSAGASSARARPVLERLAARVLEDSAQREALVQALQQPDWEAARRLVERASDHHLEQSQAWAQTIERLARGLERGGRTWTAARKKDSLQRVLDGNRSDFTRMQQRLKQLVAAWDGDVDDATVAVDAVDAEPGAEAAPPAPAAASPATPPAPAAGAAGTAAATGLPTGTPEAPATAARPAPDPAAAAPGAGIADWPPVLRHYDAALRSALPPGDERADALAGELRDLLGALQSQGVTSTLLVQAEDVCARARRLLAHRHHLVDELHRLTQEMSAGLTEFAEDDSWVKGQSESLRASLGATPSVRSVRAASDMLASTRARQRAVRDERDQARLALKDAIQRMLSELDELGDHTGRFSDSVARYVETIASADSIESLAGVVRQMVDESRAVHDLVSHTQDRLRDGRERASELEARVRTLEDELRRLSDEVSTDVLTEVANRRGLMQAFEVETARREREGGELAVGLLDIDNFKKLNDSLGHAAGDVALKSLAGHVRQQLRPIDVVARFGGEEFVVLLPGAPVIEAQQTLTRLQRSLSSSLFMHDGREVFVTFSAGVTKWRPGEPLETALERADEALYEAKRTGKNRTCIG